MRQIKIFDTTLRDGEQSPGCSMNLREKLQVAQCLERLKVDVIEAGFAIASPGDFESVQAISRQVKDCSIASLARATVKDIDTAWNAVKDAADPRIHLFLATSPLHMEYKLRMTPDEVLARVSEMTAYARKYTPNIEFPAEDATRSDREFLAKIVRAAIAAGASVVNLPDTVGYTTPAGDAGTDRVYSRGGSGGCRHRAVRPLPQRPGYGHGQLPGRRPGRRDADRMHHQRPG